MSAPKTKQEQETDDANKVWRELHHIPVSSDLNDPWRFGTDFLKSSIQPLQKHSEDFRTGAVIPKLMFQTLADLLITTTKIIDTVIKTLQEYEEGDFNDDRMTKAMIADSIQHLSQGKILIDAESRFYGTLASQENLRTDLELMTHMTSALLKIDGLNDERLPHVPTIKELPRENRPTRFVKFLKASFSRLVKALGFSNVESIVQLDNQLQQETNRKAQKTANHVSLFRTYVDELCVLVTATEFGLRRQVITDKVKEQKQQQPNIPIDEVLAANLPTQEK